MQNNKPQAKVKTTRGIPKHLTSDYNTRVMILLGLYPGENQTPLHKTSDLIYRVPMFGTYARTAFDMPEKWYFITVRVLLRT